MLLHFLVEIYKHQKLDITYHKRKNPSVFSDCRIAGPQANVGIQSGQNLELYRTDQASRQRDILGIFFQWRYRYRCMYKSRFEQLD